MIEPIGKAGGISGPMTEPQDSLRYEGLRDKHGAHYQIFYIKPETALDALRELFPDGEANDLNFVLFSTSGVHGHYGTLKEMEDAAEKYGWDPQFEEDAWPDDYIGPDVTVLVVQPRLVCMRYGNVKFNKDDLPFLKKLRESSWKAVRTIGA